MYQKAKMNTSVNLNLFLDIDLKNDPCLRRNIPKPTTGTSKRVKILGFATA